jgi:hypothetical protein
MRPENKRMQNFLAKNGINCVPKYISEGSMKGQWRLVGKNPDGTYQKWYGNTALQNKLDRLGFIDGLGHRLNNNSGNGGVFSVFVKKAR